MFGGDGGNGGSKLDITALLPGMLGGRSVDPNLLALMGNRNGFGGQDGWWSIIWLVVIASIFGWNGNGGGFFGGARGGNGLPAELAGNAGRELLMQAIQGNGNAIQQIASSLNCSTQQLQTALCNVQNTITQVGNQVGLSTNQIINAMQSGNQAILTQLADCCCKTQNAITSMGYENQLAVCQQTNTLVNTANQNARDIQSATQAQTQAILAKLDAAETRVLQDKLDAERQKNATLAAQLNNEHQTQAIMASVAQQNAPIVAALQTLQKNVDGIMCRMPNTVPVVYPQIKAYNPEVAQAAAIGAAAGNYAGGYCAYGANPGFWG